MIPSLRWGFTFLMGDSRLNEKQRQYVTYQATEMYFKNEKERRLVSDGLEGKISTDYKYAMLGQFGGQEFHATIDIEQATGIELKFLVNEQTGAAYSSNDVN